MKDKLTKALDEMAIVTADLEKNGNLENIDDYHKTLSELSFIVLGEFDKFAEQGKRTDKE